MNLYISIALTLLATVAGMYLLAKTRTEGLGKLFRFVSYTIIIVAGLSLLCQLATCACRMACCTAMCSPSENCMYESGRYHGGMNNCCDMKHGRGHGDCCKEGEGKNGCMESGEEEEHEHGMEKDSAK